MAAHENAELKDLQIFELRPLVTNFSCKLSAVTVTPFDEKQFLCLVSEENEIVLRYISAAGAQEVLKMISWFRRTNRVIHDVCFDPAGIWLLVLCKYWCVYVHMCEPFPGGVWNWSLHRKA